VKYILDGSVIGNDTNTSVIPDTPMRWTLQTETSPSGPTDSAAGNSRSSQQDATADGQRQPHMPSAKSPRPARIDAPARTMPAGARPALT
jgi:hypothetical protein